MYRALIGLRSLGRTFAFVLLAATALACAGCANPNGIGVQDFGTVTGTVADQNGKPIANAIVQITGTNSGSAYTGANGVYTISMVAVGEQTISTVTASGYAPLATPVTVVVVANMPAIAPNITLQSILPPT